MVTITFLSNSLLFSTCMTVLIFMLFVVNKVIVLVLVLDRLATASERNG